MRFVVQAMDVVLIVENAIVVLENIVRHRTEGNSREASSLIGTGEVRGAIIASTITTCVIFLPVVFMQTMTGVLFQELALVVAFSLACSLLVALMLVPMITSEFMLVTPDTDKNTKKKKIGRAHV